MKTETIKTFLRAQWPLLTVLALLLAWQVLFPIWSKTLLAPALNAPITLSPNGSTAARARVRLADTYHLRLIFETTGHDRQALGELVAGVPRDHRKALKRKATGRAIGIRPLVEPTYPPNLPLNEGPLREADHGEQMDKFLALPFPPPVALPD